jgi:hypothetical protein
MSLLDDVKVVCRVGTDKLDVEVETLIAAAIADMKRVGIDEKLLDEEAMAPLVKAAVFSFVKAHFGYDVDERAQFDESYRSLVASLLNSDANTASAEAGE